MTIRDSLQRQYLRDTHRQKRIVKKDPKQHFLHWNEERHVFLGIDERGTEWITGVDTDVPVYWEYCPNNIDYVSKGEMHAKKCNKPHLVPIYLDGKGMTCVECGNQWKIEIKIPDNMPQYQLLQQIRKEA